MAFRTEFNLFNESNPYLIAVKGELPFLNKRFTPEMGVIRKPPFRLKKDRPFIVIDAETDPFKHGRFVAPFVWGAYDGKYFFKFDTTAELMAWISTKNATVYAHNGGKFDFMLFLDYLPNFSRVKIINGRLSSFKIGKCEFRDSFLILPVPLKDFKKDEIDYAIFEEDKRNKPGNMAKIVKYLEGDCRYLYELIEVFRNKYGKGLTLAGSAMKVWVALPKQKGLDPREIPKTSAYFYNLFKPYYHGGRVECFETGIHNEKLEYMDINSAYPLAMLQKLPYGSAFYCKSTLPNTDDKISRSFIELTALSLGALPWEDPKTKKLLFPSDKEKRTFTITGWEYLSARDTGHLKEEDVIRVYTFDEMIDFKDYIDPFFEMKKNAPKDSAERLISKLFLNSLYGKFGANPEKYKEFLLIPPSEIDRVEGGAYPEYSEFTFSNFCERHAIMERPIPKYKQRFYNVATASSITGFVRAYLWRALCQTKRPFYCDTDSIIGQGFKGKVGEEIGEWKLEFTASKVGIAGKKLYALTDGTKWGKKDKDGKIKGWKIASKGSKFTGPDIMRIAGGETLEYKSEAPSMSIKTGFRFISRKIKITSG